ncbi:DUF2613 domain-containing protein [Endozoicomonas sp.]|uniref:DUF2613 domain-containing protein n=1 Tax=Endozoicomonas sp. TaxID=1892382 RepID=UPI003AF41E24
MDKLPRNGHHHFTPNSPGLTKAHTARNHQYRRVIPVQVPVIWFRPDTRTTVEISQRPLKARKVKSLNKSIKKSIAKEARKHTVKKGFLRKAKDKCSQGLKAIGKSLKFRSVQAGACGGGVLGGIGGVIAAGAIAGGATGTAAGPIGTAVGATVGGIVGVALGVGAIFGVGIISGEEQFQDLFSEKGLPHKKQWMKNTLGKEAIALLLKEVPSLEDIHTCIQAIDHAPEKLQEILLNLPNDLRRNYYRKKFEKFDAISGLYLNRAIERGLPTLRNFIEEWRYDKDFKGFEFANDLE